MKKEMAMIALVVLQLPGMVSSQQHAENIDQSKRARMGEIKDNSRFHRKVDLASEVYRAISNETNRKIPERVLKNAQCIAILPNVVTGAILVGGSHGEGLATCRLNGVRWSQPVPITLNQGSFGLQAGAKATDIVLFFQSNESVQALKKGEFTLGADASAVAGSFDASADASNAGIISYSRTEGVFAGASVNGSKIARNQDDIADYYGKNVEYVALLEGEQSPDLSGYTERLTKLLP